MDLESVLKTTILEALIEKIANIQNKSFNMPAINAFTKIITDEPEAAATAVRLITCKMQSPNEWEALQTLHLLEFCVESGCSTFQAEIGKFRFLNELIKLVSPKYLGNSTPSVIKNKIIDLLKVWSQKYPKETKIREAFDMLVKQGVVNSSSKCDVNACISPSGVTNSVRPVYEDDDEKSKILQKLLRSNKPNDLKAANHLIKTMVKEKEEKEDLRLIANNTKLLSEMLSNISPDSSTEDIELIKELKETCVNMKPTLAFMISSCNKTTRESAELFELNDLLNDTLQLYHETMLGMRKPSNSIRIRQVESCVVQSSPPTLLDFSSPVDDVPLIMPAQPAKSVSDESTLQPSPSPTVEGESTVDTLEEIFSSSFSMTDSCKNITETPGESEIKPVNSTKLFQDLNALGKSLLQSSVSACLTPNDVTKITLNDLAVKSNESVSETHESASSDDQLLSEDDDLMNGNVADEGMLNSWKSTDAEPVLQKTTFNKTSEQKTGIEPLSDVSVPLIEIKTEGDEKLTAFEDPNGICVYIQRTKNKPRTDVSVFLVLSNSRRSEPVTNFVFQPVVPKDCRLKLQSPSKSELSPFNPHIPIDTIVQIMLIASHDKEHIPLKFVISYSVENEMITEMGEVPILPLR